MKEYLSLNQNKRQQITGKIKQTLSKEKDIVFAFIFGSFLDSPSFKDIDIGVFADSIKEDEIFDYELKLSTTLAKVIKFPFDRLDVRVLNYAPPSFQSNIFARGKLLFSKDDDFLAELLEKRSTEAVLNYEFSKMSLKELLA